MAELDRFESRLAIALELYADEAPERRNLGDLVESVTAKSQRHGILARLTGSAPTSLPGFAGTRSMAGLAWLLLIIALLVTIVAFAAIGGLPRNDPLSVVPNDPAAPPELWVAYTVVDFTRTQVTYGVWITGPDGQTRPLAGTPGDRIWRMCPQFSPSGRSLARVETAGEGLDAAPAMDWALVISDFDPASGTSTNERRWPIRAGYPDCGAWSKDGATYGYATPSGSLTLLDVATGRVTDLGGRIGSRLAWSPAGTEIASIGDDGVHVRSLDGATDRLLLGRGAYNYSWLFGLSWSPDGTMLAVSGVDYPGVVTGDGQALVGPDREFVVIVSPDGLVIDDVGIQRSGMSGPNVGGETLTLGPVWSPDGRSIAYGTSMRASDAASGPFTGALRTHSLDGALGAVIDPGDTLEGPGLAWVVDDWLLVVGRASVRWHAVAGSAPSLTLAGSLAAPGLELRRGTSLDLTSAWTLAQ